MNSFDEQVLQHVRALKAIREKFLAAPNRKAAVAGLPKLEPVAEQRSSAGEKYTSYSVSVRLPDRATMERLDKAFAAVPGLKMCL